MLGVSPTPDKYTLNLMLRTFLDGGLLRALFQGIYFKCEVCSGTNSGLPSVYL